MKTKIAKEQSYYLEYKGLLGTVTIDLENDRIYGHVIGTDDKISYEADTVENIKREFKEVIDEYIEFCKEHGKDPEKSVSGKLMFRPGPEMHSFLVKAAHKCGKSVNSFLTDLVRDAAKSEHVTC